MPNDLRVRLDALAEKAGKSVEDCMTQAIQEYVENWEEYHRTVEALSEDEVRPVLKAVND
ncbi:MAG: ribbon-helix-helix protein, CopG family [Rhodospirillum sp.]|nr:ribbon-helix-helix protein, CopG family [Rhodospirillum sp.]MCF8487937.1 ribbon-helix-helix protein, CopG family [Rhodospirillum sp.]MCF8499284.1 ribbon-helix-helix protein, CopG family [Rhodospirillum sp.]